MISLAASLLSALGNAWRSQPLQVSYYRSAAMRSLVDGTLREGAFDAAAAVWEAICVAERQHEKRYNGLAANVKAGKVFKKDSKVVWRCINCGYLYEGAEAPKACPACAHPQAYFELLGENW